MNHFGDMERSSLDDREKNKIIFRTLEYFGSLRSFKVKMLINTPPKKLRSSYPSLSLNNPQIWPAIPRPTLMALGWGPGSDPYTSTSIVRSRHFESMAYGNLHGYLISKQW